jgi:hypothetical protein
LDATAEMKVENTGAVDPVGISLSFMWILFRGAYIATMTKKRS